MAQHIFTGTAAPATTPTAVGQHFIDTNNGVSYVSVGTSSSADWKIAQADGTGITTLTGDVTAGPGSGSQASTLASVGASGTYTKVTTDAKGRVTSGTTLASGDIPNHNSTIILDFDAEARIAAVSDTAYNATSWDGVTTIAPSKNAVRDEVETLITSIATKEPAITSLPATKGGTGLTTTTQGDLFYGAASNTIAKLAKSATASSFLKNSGTSNDPAWARPDLNDSTVTINNQSGTTYTIQTSDHGKTIVSSSSAGITVTVAAGLGAGFSVGLIQGGSGQITVSAASGVTINNADSQTKTAKIHAAATLLSTASNVFNFSGYTGT